MKTTKITAIIIVLMAFLVAMPSFAQQKQALLVGISDYGNPREDPGKWQNISGANDVQLLETAFTQQGFKVTSLTDSKATYKAIIDALKSFVKQCNKGDIVYMHFSMHGQPIEDKNGDEADGWDEALIPYDAQMKFAKGKYEGENHLLDDELEEYINQIRSKIGEQGQLYVVLDACHAGTASRGEGEHVRGVRDGFTFSDKLYKPDRNKETNDYFKIATAKGQSPVFFLEACRSYQQNKEVRDKVTGQWYGPLSYYIFKAMSNNNIDHSGKWIDAVKDGMIGDRRLRKQNLVIESSK